MTGRFEISQTRSQGRKVDTWTYQIPDGKADIEVTLHSKHDRVYFSASSKHAAIAGKQWEDSDIERLSAAVSQDIEAIFRDLLSDRWQPSLILNVHPSLSDRETNRRFSFDMQIDPVALDTQTPRTNDGKLRIEQQGRLTSVKERTPSDSSHERFGGKKIKLDPEGCCTVVKQTDETLKAAHAIQDTLQAFGKLLAERLSPARSNPEDIPAPHDLVEMMRKAADGI